MKLSEIPEGQGATGEIEGLKIAVYNAGDKLMVLKNVCTHRYCQTHWDKESQSWSCPCHGSRFKADGAVARGPARKPLAKVDFHIEDGEIRLG